MPTPNQIKKQINEIVKFLVEIGLADDQNYAFRRDLKGKVVQIIFEGFSRLSITLKNRNYDEIYRDLVKEQAYNVKMLDGALIQMTYKFIDKTLQLHRLAFFPSPNLEEFQQYPDTYLNDEIYGHITSKNIVPVLLRFDYDIREGNYRELVHPKAHLSLGQYPNCRIPVTSPITPVRFVDFILRNFYDTENNRYADRLPSNDCSFARSISPVECDVVHVTVSA